MAAAGSQISLSVRVRLPTNSRLEVSLSDGLTNRQFFEDDLEGSQGKDDHAIHQTFPNRVAAAEVAVWPGRKIYERLAR